MATINIHAQINKKLIQLLNNLALAVGDNITDVVDTGQFGAKAGNAYLNIDSVAGGNIIMKVQESPDGTNWFDLATSATFSTAGAKAPLAFSALFALVRVVVNLSAGTGQVDNWVALS